ncbi:MAG: hypothetical protein Q7S05_03175 [bacterium]|nr:hypothetical protein [bacterium]
MLFPIIVFFISLLGIVALFGIKHWERVHERILYPIARERADAQAIKIKELVRVGRIELSKLPPQAVVLGKRAVHAGALGAARLARGMEVRAHQLADMVSHKHSFEKRETRSEFLKQVGEHPISNNHVAKAAPKNDDSIVLDENK